jgi:hypothetical protein
LRISKPLILSDVYVDACEAYGKVPCESAMALWASVLGEYRPQDVERALRVWAGNDELNEYTGRARGATMPSPADLKAIVRRAPKLRPKFCNHCMGGWVITGGASNRVAVKCVCAGGVAMPENAAVSVCE